MNDVGSRQVLRPGARPASSWRDDVAFAPALSRTTSLYAGRSMAMIREPTRQLSRRWRAMRSRSTEENLEEWFRLQSQKSTLTREVLAGCVNYLTTLYIINVNPLYQCGVIGHLETGMPFKPLVTSTAVASGLGTMAMGAFANAPLVLAPGHARVLQ